MTFLFCFFRHETNIDKRGLELKMLSNSKSKVGKVYEGRQFLSDWHLNMVMKASAKSFSRIWHVNFF